MHDESYDTFYFPSHELFSVIKEKIWEKDENLFFSVPICQPSSTQHPRAASAVAASVARTAAPTRAVPRPYRARARPAATTPPLPGTKPAPTPLLGAPPHPTVPSRARQATATASFPGRRRHRRSAAPLSDAPLLHRREHVRRLRPSQGKL
jgi:hypothetical protein